MKQPQQPVTLELGIRALEHEKLAYAPREADIEWRVGYDIGYRSGLEHAIQTLKNLDVANQQLGP